METQFDRVGSPSIILGMFSIRAWVGLLVLITCLWSPVAAEEAKQEAKKKPKINSKPIYYYSDLIETLRDFDRNPNRISAKSKQQDLIEDYKNQIFKIEADIDVITAKRSLTKESTVWLKCSELDNIDVKLVFEQKFQDQVELLTVYDYIICKAELISFVKNQITFRFKRLDDILAYNPKEKQCDYNVMLKKARGIMESDGYDVRGQLDLHFENYRHRLGTLTGKILRVEEVNRRPVLIMEVDGQKVEVFFILRYRNSLKEIVVGRETLVLTRCAELPFKGTPKFFRGVFISPH